MSTIEITQDSLQQTLSSIPTSCPLARLTGRGEQAHAENPLHVKDAGVFDNLLSTKTTDLVPREQ